MLRTLSVQMELSQASALVGIRSRNVMKRFLLLEPLEANASPRLSTALLIRQIN